VAKLIQLWLELGGVRPQFTWTPDAGAQILFGCRPAWEPLPAKPTRLMGHLHGTTLFGALAIQLMIESAEVEALVVCSACQTQYLPKRRLAITKRNFCPSCRDAGVSVRLAKRDSDARLRRGERRRPFRRRT
jgi:hypothetical protein